MIIKYIICGPVAAVLGFVVLTSFDVTLVPALLVSWLFGSISVGVLAVYFAFSQNLGEHEAQQKERKKAPQSSVDNISTLS